MASFRGSIVVAYSQVRRDFMVTIIGGDGSSWSALEGVMATHFEDCHLNRHGEAPAHGTAIHFRLGSLNLGSSTDDNARCDQIQQHLSGLLAIDR